jgi:choice-of-anchor C domain-containing protein
MKARNVLVALGVIGAAACGLQPCASAANLLINGGFDTYAKPPSTWTAPNYADYNLAVGNAAITGWTVSRGVIDYTSSSFWIPQNGIASLDLTGSPGNGGIQQSFATIAGNRYEVSFYIAGNPDTWDMQYGTYLANKTMSVEVAGEKHDYEYNVQTWQNSPFNMKWQHCVFDFTANSTASTLEFYGTMPITCYAGMGLDNVLVSSVPEPSMLGLLFGAVSIALLCLRRRTCAG